MGNLATRLAKLEGSLGEDDFDRYVRSLTDEQLEAELVALDAKARNCLEARGVACADMDIKDVLDRLVEIEKLEACHVDAA